MPLQFNRNLFCSDMLIVRALGIVWKQGTQEFGAHYSGYQEYTTQNCYM